MTALEEREERRHHSDSSPHHAPPLAAPLSEVAVAKELDDSKSPIPVKELGRSASLSDSERNEIAAQNQSAGSATPHAKWYRKLNPLKLRRVRPIPAERTISREYGEGFWSMITFHWMAPLMAVSLMPVLLQFVSLAGRGT